MFFSSNNTFSHWAKRLLVAGAVLALSAGSVWAADIDGDGIPDDMEAAEGLNPGVKDNDVFTNSRLFVMQQYRDFYSREASAAEIASAKGQIDSGAVTRAQMQARMLADAAFTNYASPVSRLYAAYFLRNPDEGGFQFWFQQYSTSAWTFLGISEFFAQSPEFKQRYGALNNTQFTDLVYRNVLKRDPDPSGRAFWISKLDGGMPRGEMMAAFSESPENKAVTANAVKVAQAYLVLVRRPPDAGGEAFWQGRLAQGADIAELTASLFGTPEYRNRFMSGSGGPEPFDAKAAARLLQQGTWGVPLAEITRVQGIGAPAWLNEQFAIPATSYTAYAEQNIANNKTGANDCTGMNQQYGCPWQVNFPAFYKQAFEGNDQLRQRVANALLQIVVISIANNRVLDAGTAMPNYLDMLGKHAFGNFRDLLKDVTLHPGMGVYLDMLGSSLEVPNENYARELLQLFSVGTVMLNDDGTVKKDAQGNTIPTYDEDIVKGFSKAFTGWHFADQDTTKSWKFYWPDEKWTVAMKPWKARRCPQDGRWPAGSTTDWCDINNPAKSYPPPHDTGTKKLLQYAGAPFANLPAGQTPEQDLENAIDNVFNHPNVGPFIVKQLIQRLVTSNPSPAYVQRVVAVFNNNGSGVRGDMKSVVRAILLDSDARTSTAAASNTFGKLREPVWKFLHLHRAFNARTSSGYYDIWDLSDPNNLGQAPIKAPSVFNYYLPDFSPSGPLGQAGLVGPEFQITTTAAVGGFSSFTGWAVVGGFGQYDSNTAKWIRPNYDRYLSGGTPLADNPQAMVDELDLLLTAGNLKAKFKTDLVNMLTKITRTNVTEQREQRFRAAMWQIIHSAEYAVQR